MPRDKKRKLVTKKKPVVQMGGILSYVTRLIPGWNSPPKQIEGRKDYAESESSLPFKNNEARSSSISLQKDHSRESKRSRLEHYVRADATGAKSEKGEAAKDGQETKAAVSAEPARRRQLLTSSDDSDGSEDAAKIEREVEKHDPNLSVVFSEARSVDRQTGDCVAESCEKPQKLTATKAKESTATESEVVQSERPTASKEAKQPASPRNVALAAIRRKSENEKEPVNTAGTEETKAGSHENPSKRVSVTGNGGDREVEDRNKKEEEISPEEARHERIEAKRARKEAEIVEIEEKLATYRASLDAMPLKERREEVYACGNEYRTLKDVKRWPDLAREQELLAESSVSGHGSKQDLSEKIGIFTGDITTLEIDAIVNAANNTLLGGGGVDGAIHRAAGKALLRHCSLLHGCETGDAKITPGYCLPAKFVIHTVGPRGEKPAALSSCYKRSLELAVENGARTVAFPCISTGIYGYPTRKAAPVALEAVRAFLADHPDKFDMIIFCLFTTNDKAAYAEHLPRIFPVLTEQKSD